jgi:hypothetical protein
MRKKKSRTSRAKGSQADFLFFFFELLNGFFLLSQLALDLLLALRQVSVCLHRVALLLLQFLDLEIR